MAEAEYEYVVVGSGAGGGTCAARLAEAGHKVLLLEAGGDPLKLQGDDPIGKDRLPEDYHVPLFHPFATENDALRWSFFVNHYSDPERAQRDPKYVPEKGGVLYPRSGALGGCTVHNAMIVVYPHNEDWDNIAYETGDNSWNSDNMRKYFQKLENCHHRFWFYRFLSKFGINWTRHGWNGWLRTELALPWRDAIRDAKLIKVIIKSVFEIFEDLPKNVRRLGWSLMAQGDPNDWRLVKDKAVGLRYAPLSTDHHARTGARERVIDVATRFPENLTIELDALATRVLFDEDNRAVGVEYLKGSRLYRAHADPSDEPGKKREVRASREVILAGGAYNTPQLLMLSGIGPQDELKRWGIEVRVPLEGVGRNLQDRYEVGVISKMKEEWEILQGVEFSKGDPKYEEWEKHRRGPYTTNSALLAIIQRSLPERALPDLFSFVTIGKFRGYYPDWPRDALNKDYLSWIILKAHTNNTAGRVTLRSTDPQDMPQIDFHYFDEGNDERGDDVKSVVEGVKFMRNLNKGISDYIEDEELPGPDVQTDEEIAQFVKDHAWGHHASCTCKIGQVDDNGVLDSKFRVHGTKNLRVVDASIFPKIPGFFIVTSVYTAAEKAADVILEATGQHVPQHEKPPFWRRRGFGCLLLLFLLFLLTWIACRDKGPVPDEAQAVGRMEDSLAGSEIDYFAEMDYGLTQDAEKVRQRLDKWVPGISAEDAVKSVVRGRNNWIVWTGGNDRFWDVLSLDSVGTLDFLKTVSSHPAQGYGRYNRWEYMGSVNEPCFAQWTPPEGCEMKTDRWGCGNPERFGLWVDKRAEGCAPDPFEDATLYPGVKTGARGRDGFPIGSYYGYGSGIIGLRLFPNPNFDEKAEKAWDPYRYYTEPSYYNDRDLVKPYRVGQSCGFCHVGPNPSNPPADFNEPEWANLNSNPGTQYFWTNRLFYWDWKHQTDNFIYQLFQSYPPGTIDTSLISSDNINNPRTMNAIYEFASRLEVGGKWGHEEVSGGELDNKQFNDFVPPVPQKSPLLKYYTAPSTNSGPGLAWTPHVLKDGADSVGGLGSLNRVYINVGLYSEEWMRHFDVFVGGRITPMEISVSQEYSSYWRATENQTLDLALYFLASGDSDDLAAAPGGPEIMAQAAARAVEQGGYADAEAMLTRGKVVFAETCARCHSSKLPEEAFERFFPSGSVGSFYLTYWDQYWEWTKTEEFKSKMRDMVLAEDFLEYNYLSNELRIPVTLLETQACSPLATNAIKGDIWDNFSSSSYKALPSVGTYEMHDPFTGEVFHYKMPGGGRGYTRVPSLVSAWSTAPYLVSNSLGYFNWYGTVEGRISSFEDSITKLLWPERRAGKEYGSSCEESEIVTRSGKKHPVVITKTTEPSYLRLPRGFVPKPAQWIAGLFCDGDEENINCGPIPACTPTNLLANIDSATPLKSGVTAFKAIRQLKDLPAEPTNEQFSEWAAPLLEVSKCRDFATNRGHYFGTDYLPASEGEPGLSDADKLALIEFLRTM